MKASKNMSSSLRQAVAAVTKGIFQMTHNSFAEFYPFYLGEHSNRTCRRLHFAGSSLSLLCLAALVATRNPWWLLAGLLSGEWHGRRR